jgi:hypothetical protein
MKIGSYCQFQLYTTEDVIKAFKANTSLYHIRKIYFDEEALQFGILVTDVEYVDNKNWMRAKLDIDKDHILKCLTDPINMNYQEILQARIIRFFDDDEEDIDVVLPVDLEADYGRGLIISKSIFE